jgi:hypothetical protein
MIDSRRVSVTNKSPRNTKRLAAISGVNLKTAKINPTKLKILTTITRYKKRGKKIYPNIQRSKYPEMDIWINGYLVNFD